MEVHPVAALFPMLSEPELRELADDIDARGQDHPIITWTDPETGDTVILDGRNRHAACELAGVEPWTEEFKGDDPAAYALANNVHRRHLSTGARAIIVAQARRLTGQSQRAAAADTDLYQPRLAEADLVIDYAPDRAAAVVAGDALSKAVEVARERKREIEARDAKLALLTEHAPDLIPQVEDGQWDLDEAIDVMEGRLRREEERREEQEEAERAQMAEEEREAARLRAARLETAERMADRVKALCRGFDQALNIQPGGPEHPYREEVIAMLNEVELETLARFDEVTGVEEE